MSEDARPSDEFICDSDQCGYLGADANAQREEDQSSFSKTTSQPCAVFVVGCVLFGIVVGVSPGLGALILVMTVLLTIVAKIRKLAKNLCPACQSGKLVDVKSDRGQALWRRHQTKFGSDE